MPEAPGAFKRFPDRHDIENLATVCGELKPVQNAVHKNNLKPVQDGVDAHIFRKVRLVLNHLYIDLSCS